MLHIASSKQFEQSHWPSQNTNWGTISRELKPHVTLTLPSTTTADSKTKNQNWLTEIFKLRNVSNSNDRLDKVM